MLPGLGGSTDHSIVGDASTPHVLGGASSALQLYEEVQDHTQPVLHEAEYSDQGFAELAEKSVGEIHLQLVQSLVDGTRFKTLVQRAVRAHRSALQGREVDRARRRLERGAVQQMSGGSSSLLQTSAAPTPKPSAEDAEADENALKNAKVMASSFAPFIVDADQISKFELTPPYKKVLFQFPVKPDPNWNQAWRDVLNCPPQVPRDKCPMKQHPTYPKGTECQLVDGKMKSVTVGSCDLSEKGSASNPPYQGRAVTLDETWIYTSRALVGLAGNGYAVTK